ncbi:hypothetical protein SAFG77S_01300 [Streptomyces afghaniensis]
MRVRRHLREAAPGLGRAVGDEVAVAHGGQHLQVVAAVAEREGPLRRDAEAGAQVPDDVALAAHRREEVDVVAVGGVPGGGVAAADVEPEAVLAGEVAHEAEALLVAPRVAEGAEVVVDQELGRVPGVRGVLREQLDPVPGQTVHGLRDPVPVESAVQQQLPPLGVRAGDAVGEEPARCPARRPRSVAGHGRSARTPSARRPASRRSPRADRAPRPPSAGTPPAPRGGPAAGVAAWAR